MRYLGTIALLIFVSCQQEVKIELGKFNSNEHIVSGSKIKNDSLQIPYTFQINNGLLKTTIIGKPDILPTNTNRHWSKTPTTFSGESKELSTSIKDTLLLPTKLLVFDSVFNAGMPEIVVAKDGHTKDRNPQNFRSLSKLQGLKHGNIRCLMQDHLGNVWLGTEGGGVSKFDGKSFTHFTNKEGLPYNDIRCILQDRQKNIWFGTNGSGIAMYDGINFTHFVGNEIMRDLDVLAMCEDYEGNIWFGTDGYGIIKYNPSLAKNDSARFLNISKQHGLGDNIVWTLKCDKNNNIWIGTEEGGLNFYDGNSFTQLNTSNGLPINHILKIEIDSKENLWLGTEGAGVCKIKFEDILNPLSGYIIENYTIESGLSGNVISDVLEDNQGNIWFTSPGSGACKFVLNDSGNKPYFEHFGSDEGLTNDAISSLLQDKFGNIWFATYGGGISKYDGKLFTHFTDKEGLPSPHIWSMTEDHDKNMWFGTSSEGICKYDGQFFYRFDTEDGLCHNDIRSMFCDKAGNIWFGSQGKGVTKYIPADQRFNSQPTFTTYNIETGLFGNDVRNIIEDKYGNYWFALSGSGLTKFDGKTFTHFKEENGLSENDVRCVIEDDFGNIWVGTNGGGVTKIQQTIFNGVYNYEFTHFKKLNGFPDDYIICACKDNTGNIWFGSYGSGAIKVSPKNDNYLVVALTEEIGIANNFVFSILQDSDHNLWFGTRFGISKLTPEKLNYFNQKSKENSFAADDVFFKNYNYEDGFLGIGCNGKAIFQSTSGIIWIGSNDRLTALHPQGENVFADTIPPNIQITALSIFNEKIPWTILQNSQDTTFLLGNGVQVGDFEFDSVSRWYGVPQNLSLSHENNYLTFHFSGITMFQPGSVKYQYKLDGIDENWSAIDKRTEAAYGNLPHGEYTFRVKAMNSAGVWSDEVHYNFSIRPPWWKTWLFRIIMTIVFIVLLYLIFLWRTNSLRRRQKQLEKTVLERTQEVVVQKQLIERKHKEITDSINYAERIQRSFLASSEMLEQNLKSFFIFFKPKDVVSGDFYWTTKLENGQFALVTADSTGHGVPGAIMSILNITCLEKATEEAKLVDPAEILNHTRNSIIERLKKDGSAEGGKDGMDASIITFDFNTNEMFYAAANNPVWVVRNGFLIELEPDHMPVAYHDKQIIPFKSKKIQLVKGDVVYSFTDGLADQFGGPKGKKFMYKRLKELFLSISIKSMTEQHKSILMEFENWRSNVEQVDDICVIGIKI